jgi:hypothetical protein
MVQDAYENAETIKEKVKIMKKNKIIPGYFKSMPFMNDMNKIFYIFQGK